jgi:hypothetical protein
MDLLFHMLIPVMLAWIVGVNQRKALMLAPIAIIPDLDVLLSAHRVYLHTLFIPIAIAVVSYLYKLKRGFHQDLIFLASLFYLSHLLLDFFPGPVAILWPLTNVGYGLNVSLTVSQKNAIPTVKALLAVTAKKIQIPNVVTNAEVVTPQSVVTAILLLAAIVMVQHKKILRVHK